MSGPLKNSPAAQAREGLRRLVLVGAGHAHLFTIARIAEFTRRGFEVVVIAPENFWYSGLATGVLGGRYAPEEDQVDVEALVVRGGGRFFRERASAIDAATRTLHLPSGAVRYDVLSLNLGSETKPLPGDTGAVFPIKPLHHLWRLRQRLEAERSAGQCMRVVVAGGGASGCEIAANIHALVGAQAEITILAGTRGIAPSLPPRAAAALAHWLETRGISLKQNSSVREVVAGVVLADDGAEIPFDFLVNASGLHPPAILRESGLPVSDDGALLVDETLRAMDNDRIFGGGDAVHFGSRGLPKVGVFAVRQAPVLFANLLATLEGRRLQRFRPQRDVLLILNLGGGEGLVTWRQLFWRGRAAFWLKDWIDRRFLARSRRAVGAP